MEKYQTVHKTKKDRQKKEKKEGQQADIELF